MADTHAPPRGLFLGLGVYVSLALALALDLVAAPTWGATLVGYWNLNEGTGAAAADTSGSGNNGTLINSPAWIAGQAGNALDFAAKGTGYVSVAPATSLANLYSNGMTVAAWIRPRSAGLSGVGRIVDKDNNDAGWFLAMSGPTKVRFAVDEFLGTQPSRLSTDTVTVNKWQHVAATWDGSAQGANIHVYINGVLADGTAVDGSGGLDSDSGAPLSIGNRPVDLARSFDGGVDEVRVYSGVLSAAEIAALAAGTPPPPPPPPPPPDTQPPTVPTGLTPSNVTTSDVTLAWTASTDLPNPGGAGLGGYFVYRNGATTPVATITSGTSFTDSGLASATSYTYQVAAFDKASPANVSARSSVLTVVTQTPAPSVWSGGDIGSVGAAGSSSGSGSTFTVTGSGTDIWGTADSFQFVSQPLSGDGSITARIVSQTRPSDWAKAGVMFRETLTPGSKFAATLITASHGAETEARTTTGGTATGGVSPAAAVPYWVRMVRAGNVLTGYISANGSTWATTGSFTVSMAPSLSVGLAVTSHLRGSLSTAVFDNVSVSAVQTGPPPGVSVTPTLATLTLGSLQQFTATVAGGSPVTWTVDGVVGGNGSVGTISQSGLYTAGSVAGTHIIVAASAADSTNKASAIAAVTDLVGVYTYHNDLNRDGANTQEYALTTSNVNTAHFGKLAACTVDGTISGQPLWVANRVVNGVRRNVVLAATQHDGLFAFDADASPCVKLWSANLIDGSHGGTSTETPVPFTLIGDASGDIQPEVGVSGTPVIDPSTNTLYVVSKSIDSAHTYFQRLHAINLITGQEMPGSPVAITGSYPGTGDGGSTVAFNARQEHERAGLTLANGLVYLTWASHEDSSPWYGWIMGYRYDGAAFTQQAIINVAPNAQRAGIWMGGGAPSVDAGGKLYVITGNGTFDATGTAPNNDYGDSLLQLTPSLTVSQWFTPSDQLSDNQNDKDFGSGGAALLADLPAGNTVTHALICGGKDHSLFVLNRDLLGGFGDTAAVQKINFGASIFGTGAFWNNSFYLAGLDGALQAYQLNTQTAQFAKSSASSHVYGFPGATPSVSSSGAQNGIVWSLDAGLYCTQQARGCGPAVLYAHDASNLSSELWNSSHVAADAAGHAVKFSVPTVANGKVYVGTRGNNTGGAASSTSIPGELEIYGLKP